LTGWGDRSSGAVPFQSHRETVRPAFGLHHPFYAYPIYARGAAIGSHLVPSRHERLPVAECAHRACRTDTWVPVWHFWPSFCPQLKRAGGSFRRSQAFARSRIPHRLFRPGIVVATQSALPSSDSARSAIRAPWLHDHYSLPGYYGPSDSRAQSRPVMDCRTKLAPAPCLQTRVSQVPG